jgi:hypothetical protein
MLKRTAKAIKVIFLTIKEASFVQLEE